MPCFLICLALAGCQAQKHVAEEWLQQVDAGEYGWVTFNTMERKNLDIAPEPTDEQFTDQILASASARECLYWLHESGQVDRLTLTFLIDREGWADRFYLEDSPYQCRRNAFYYLEGIRFRPGYRNGEAVPVVGIVTVRFNYRELGKLEGVQ